MKPRVLLLAILLGTLAIPLLNAKDSLSQADQCQDAQIIFARGSGQEVSIDKEWIRFHDQVDVRLKNSGIKYDFYELGTTPQNGHQYPAVSVENIITLLGAKISGGDSYAYGNSVREGILELTTYLHNQHEACPETHFVLSGFSQGAHVVGQSFSAIPRSIRDSIVFVALFGDPKLHLPEGEGWPNPPACFGKDHSPWRREGTPCRTDDGSLDAREPYVIDDDMQQKVGLWCLKDDFICGSSSWPWTNSGHDKYKEPSGPIDQAAQEIAEKLRTEFTYQSHLGEIDTAPRANQPPDVKDIQILFMVDRTVNMQHDYPNYFLPKMRALVQSLPPDAVIGFDYYTGCWRKDDPAKYNWALLVPHYTRDYDTKDGWLERSTRDATWMNSDVVGSIDGLPYFSVEPGCDLSWELGVHAWRAMADFVQSYWPIDLPRASTLWANDDRQRIIIPVTNAPYHPNDTKFGDNNGLLTQATTNPQTTVIPLVPDNIRHTFEDLEDLHPNSQVLLRDDDQIDETITEHFGTNRQIESRLRNTDYRFPPGTTATFDASPTLVHEDTIAKYEWDFNNDGAIDTTTTQPSTSHTYHTSPLENTMTVKVTTASGLSDTATANVRIINLADLPPVPAAPHSLLLEPTGTNSVQFSWKAGDDLVDKYMIYINSVPMGYIENDQTSIEIGDLRVGEDTVFGVQALSSEYEASEMATIILPAQNSPLTPNGAISPSSPTSSNTLSPAKNIVEAVARVFGLGGNPISSGSDTHDRLREPSFALVYYIIGGIVATGLIALFTRRIFLRFKKHKA